MNLQTAIEVVTNAQIFGERLSSDKIDNISRFIAGQVGQPGSYGGLPAPTKREYEGVVALPMGEKLTSWASKGHILGEEACRALIVLNSKKKQIKDALNTAREKFGALVDKYEEEEYKPFGMFCCGTCTPAFWRNLQAGGLNKREERIDAGLKILHSWRDGKGAWRRFPFWYTSLALSDLDSREAIEEMRYAADKYDRAAKRKDSKDKFQMRRKRVSELILAKL